MKKSSKISLILLTSATFLAGCSPYQDKDCRKDKKGNCIQSGSQSINHGGYHWFPVPIVSNSHNTSKVNASRSHSPSVSRGGFGTTAHFSASS
jgi:hypothetical protein